MITNSLFLKSIIIGLSISLPIGPVGILCLQRLFTRGPMAGLLSGLGAATADLFYALVAMFSLYLLEPSIRIYENYFKILGGIVFIILGTVIFLSKPGSQTKQSKPSSLLQSYVSTFFIVLSNPALVFMFFALLTAADIDTSTITASNLISIGLGIFCGSSLWWVVIGIISSKYHIKFDNNTLHKLNMIAGLLIVGFGLFGIISAVIKIL
jgi:threonine/homoserine/homoserine lactone efflux protein